VLEISLKVASSLTDVWEQFEQQDITVICTVSFLHKNHTSAPEPGDTVETDMHEHVYQKPVRDVDELKQHAIETWSATNRALLIK